MEKVKIRYDKRRYQSLIVNLTVLKQTLDKKRKFLNEYQELYKLPKSKVSKNLRFYDDIITAIETIENVEFRNNVFSKKAQD